MITRKPKPSFAEEARQFRNTATATSSDDLRIFAPRLDRRLREQERERSAILTALDEIPVGGRVPALTLLRRIRALVKAENQAVFDCYWHDLGGEGGA